MLKKAKLIVSKIRNRALQANGKKGAGDKLLNSTYVVQDGAGVASGAGAGATAPMVGSALISVLRTSTRLSG
jgi:hypothetical protein